MTEQIKAKAAEMFFRYGLKSISMDDLAKSAGMSKKTLYQYYSNKNELVGDVAAHLLACHKQAYTNAAAQAKDAVEEIVLQSSLPASVLPMVDQAFFFELEKYFANEWDLLLKFRDSFLLPALQKTIERGIAENVFRADLM